MNARELQLFPSFHGLVFFSVRMFGFLHSTAFYFCTAATFGFAFYCILPYGIIRPHDQTSAKTSVFRFCRKGFYTACASLHVFRICLVDFALGRS